MNGMVMSGGAIGMVAFWAILIWGAVYLARRVGSRDTSGHESALDILERRYARGDIDDDELEARRRSLRGD